MVKKKLKEPVLNELTKEEQKMKKQIEKMQEENEELKTQTIIQEELKALENPNLYRYRMLILMQKITKSLEERNELLKEQNKLIKSDSGEEDEDEEEDYDGGEEDEED